MISRPVHRATKYFAFTALLSVAVTDCYAQVDDTDVQRGFFPNSEKPGFEMTEPKGSFESTGHEIPDPTPAETVAPSPVTASVRSAVGNLDDGTRRQQMIPTETPVHTETPPASHILFHANDVMRKVSEIQRQNAAKRPKIARPAPSSRSVEDPSTEILRARIRALKTSAGSKK